MTDQKQNQDPKPQKKGLFDNAHIDWSQNIPSKTLTNQFIGSDPNDFYKQNLQFLTGQPSPNMKSVVKRPIFRLAILLDSGPNSLAKKIHIENSSDPREINNVPSDYYNITNKNNLDNLSVFFLDFVFEWTVDEDKHDWVKPIWINEVSSPTFIKTQDNDIRLRPLKSLSCYHLRPFGKPKNGIIYNDHNPVCRDFWQQIISSYYLTDEQKEKYSKIYTIWFQKKYFGYNVLEEIFKDTSFNEQVKYFKDTCLNKKIIDLFDLSDLIAKNDLISKKNNIFLLFTKWLNYKATTMSASKDTFNKKYLESASTETITIDFFKRIDDLFYYSTKCFINILDQCLYENWVNQIGSKGTLLEDFFEKDFAIGGTHQDMDQSYVEFVDEKPQVHAHEIAAAKKAPTKKKKTSKKKGAK